VDEPAIGSPSGFHHALGERRVAVDDPGHLGVAALEGLGVHELLDELRGLRADDVAAHELAVALVADDLDDARAVAVDRAGADRAVVDLADHDVHALLARLGLREAEGGDVRRAEGGPRDVDVLERVRLEARPSTSMRPRSSKPTPAASSPSASTSGPRPAAMTR
jgi:hypothetical protein